MDKKDPWYSREFQEFLALKYPEARAWTDDLVDWICDFNLADDYYVGHFTSGNKVPDLSLLETEEAKLRAIQIDPRDADLLARCFERIAAIRHLLRHSVENSKI